VTPFASGAGSVVWSRRAFLVVCSMVPFIRPARAAAATVEIRQFKFAPADIEVAVGSTVTFTNLDLVPHSATGDAFDTGTLKKGESKEITFAEAGDFPYLCTLHRHMKGRVRVR
jgi:plastocyanin